MMAQETVPLNQCFHLNLSTFDLLSSPSPWSSSLSAEHARSGVLHRLIASVNLLNAAY